MTQVFLMGTFHFRESEIDFNTDELQSQLWDINEQLMSFEPDAIALEVATHAQDAVDASYAKFSLDDLSDYEKMQTETLGTINIWGGTYPIAYKNEIVQIGYRLGKRLGIDRIHAIDDDTTLDVITEDAPMLVQQAFDKHLKMMGDLDAKTLREKLRQANSNEWSYHNQQLYMTKNVVGAGSSYEGARYFGQWYMRNLKIFANLQKLCEKYSRIFLLYGCGHLYILRELIRTCEDMELVSYCDYL